MAQASVQTCLMTRWTNQKPNAQFISGIPIPTVSTFYFTGMDKGLRMYPLKLQWWGPPMPFALLILMYDECRKYILRALPPGSWIERETYY